MCIRSPVYNFLNPYCTKSAHEFTVNQLDIDVIGARNRNRTGTPAINEATDFKSVVSTYFTTRALGGGSRNRTGVNGFAGRCITILLSRHIGVYTSLKKQRKARCFPRVPTLCLFVTTTIPALFV